SPAYIFIKDLEGRYIVSGDKFTAKVGWPKGYLLGKTDDEIFPKPVADILKSNDRKVINAGKAISVKESFSLADQEITNISVKFPLFDTQGKITGVAGIATDISELVQAENKLKDASKILEQQVHERTKELSEEIEVRQRTELELQKILSSSPVGVCISEKESGALSFANKSICDLLDTTKEELISSSTLPFWRKSSYRDEMLSEFNETGGAGPKEIKLHRKNGQSKWVSLSWTKLTVGNKEKIVSWLYDISQIKEAETLFKSSQEQLEKRVALRTSELESEIEDRRKIEDALRESEAKFKASANSASDWFWGMDQTYRFNSFSERMEEITGINPKDLLGSHSWKALTTNLKKEQWDKYKSELINTKPFRDFKFDVVRKDGSVLPVSISGIPIFDDLGFFKGYRGAGRDISQELIAEEEAKKLEQQLQQSQKMEAIGQLTGGVAHDFNNILAIILGNLDLVNDEISEESSLHSFIKAIEGSALRGAQLTQRLLAYSRKQALHPQKADLDELAGGILELMERLLSEAITLHYNPSKKLQPVFADSSQIENALMNLCINSSDAMPNGGDLFIKTGNLTVTETNVQDYPDLKEGQYSWLSVRDTGSGMDATTLNHAFEPFFTTKEIGKGTGLGLSMIFGFAKQSNGTILIERELG
ncbi:MAG: PAS domain S-box protein, partial [Sneathiella sp.]|nr:PAS domain S-box protein [Sneathiella sp.]